MKLKEIIERLCAHEINKHEAIEMIENIVESFQSKASLKVEIKEIGFFAESDGGYIKLNIPYRKIEHLKRGDYVFLNPSTI